MTTLSYAIDTASKLEMEATNTKKLSSNSVKKSCNDETKRINDESIDLEIFGDSKTHPDQRRPFHPENHGLSPDFRLTKFGDNKSRGTKPNRRILDSVLSKFRNDDDDFSDDNEDGASGRRNEKKATKDSMMILGEETLCTRLKRYDLYLMETSNLMTPLVDDPYTMGRIACLSVLSGIYAMGIVECATTRMILAISNRMEDAERDVVIPLMIEGYRDAAKSSGTMAQSARISLNPWCLIGGTASALSTRYDVLPPDGAIPGDVIVVTKPLGTAIALTASQWMEQPERTNRFFLTVTNDEIIKAKQRALDSMLRSNREAALLMKKYNAHAACDISSYGIVGHADMLAKRQRESVDFIIHNLPVIAKMHAVSRITAQVVDLHRGILEEYSGGLIIILPREQAAAYCKDYSKHNSRQAWIVGLVEVGDREARVIGKPRIIEVPDKETDDKLW